MANDRRLRKGDRTKQLKRLVKGRKGIGVFVGLMVANVMENLYILCNPAAATPGLQLITAAD